MIDSGVLYCASSTCKPVIQFSSDLNKIYQYENIVISFSFYSALQEIIHDRSLTSNVDETHFSFVFTKTSTLVKKIAVFVWDIVISWVGFFFV